MTEIVPIWEKKIITWAAGIFFNTKWEILSVLEREGEKQQKSRKRAGQLFVPAWKKRSHETMKEAMRREAWEEGGLKEEFNIFGENDLHQKWELKLETHDAILSVEVFWCKKELAPDVLETYHNFYTHEIIQRAFFDIRELLEFDLDKIRPWLYEIIYLFYWGKVEETIYIENGKYRAEDGKRIEDIKQKIRDLL